MSNTQHAIRNTFSRTGGWPGGTVGALALLPGGELLAGTKAGLFRSADGGQGWQRVANGPAAPAIVALAGAGDEIFAATEGGRLYRSTDGGGTWPEVAGWAGFGVGVAIALSPAYAADATLFVATADGPFRSQDRGASWEIANFGLLDVDTLCIAFSPNFAADETLWAGTAFGGFFRSRNAGRSWRESGEGLPDAAVQCLAVDEAGVLYAGTESDGVFRSRDGGARWERAGEALAGLSVNALAALPGGLLAGTGAGLYRSTDDGQSWQPCNRGDFAAFALAGEGQRLFAGGWQRGVFGSTDGGASWQELNGSGDRLLTGHAPPLAVLTPWQELFVADSDGSSAFSTDGGRSWRGLDFLGEEESCGFLAGAGQGDDFALFAWAEEALYRRQGHGEWERLPAPGNGAAHLAVSPHFSRDGALLLADLDGYLYLSEDRGESWQELAPPETDGDVLGLALAPGFAEEGRAWLVTGAFDGAHVQVEVWQSDDGGQSWAEIAGLALDTPALSLRPLADPLRRPLLLAAQNRLITLYTDPESGELAVEQHFLAGDVQIVRLADGQAGAADTDLPAATNQGVWRIRPGSGEAECIGLAERQVVAVFAQEEGVTAVVLGGEVWQK